MAEVIRESLFSVQVCVPKDWTDKEVTKFVEAERPCGTEHGWQIRKGDNKRVQCEQHPDHCHLMFDA